MFALLAELINFQLVLYFAVRLHHHLSPRIVSWVFGFAPGFEYNA